MQVTLQDVRDLCAQIQSYRSNLATDDVTVIETSLKNGFGLLHLHHVSAFCLMFFIILSGIAWRDEWRSAPRSVTVHQFTALDSLFLAVLHFIFASSTWTSRTYA